MANAILLITCPDQSGLVARLSGFIAEHGGNIIHADHHIDPETGLFLTRIEWDIEHFDIERDAVGPACDELAQSINADECSLRFSDARQRISIWVSREDHCLLELLWRQRAGDLHAEIPLVISNHENLRSEVEQYGIEFRHVPILAETKPAQEELELNLLREFDIDLVVLAKYMQILSPNLIRKFPKIINIHHSFLPAFAGARPYHQAYERGVKLIGATAHYATPDLDAGPIINQDTVSVGHRDQPADLARKGKDLERLVLARAVDDHLGNRVLTYRNKTVVFA